MTEREKRIEEMSDKERTVIGMERVLYPLMNKYSDSELLDGVRRGWNSDLECLYDAGYRKADEVRKETAKNIYCELYKISFKDENGMMHPSFENWVNVLKKFGVEVEE